MRTVKGWVLYDCYAGSIPSKKKFRDLNKITWEPVPKQTSEIVTTTITEIDLILKFFLNDHMEIKKPKVVGIVHLFL